MDNHDIQHRLADIGKIVNDAYAASKDLCASHSTGYGPDIRAYLETVLADLAKLSNDIGGVA